MVSGVDEINTTGIYRSTNVTIEYCVVGLGNDLMATLTLPTINNHKKISDIIMRTAKAHETFNHDDNDT